MDVLSYPVLWATLVGVGIPLVIAAINQPRWPGWAKAVVTALVCVIVGAVTAWQAGELTGKTFATAAMIVFGAAVASYNLYWKPSGIAPAIEAAIAPRDRGAIQSHRP